jgi:predicted N-acetyltransferase YhbS
MHQLLEDAQVEALKKNQTIAQVYNREFFEQVYQKYIEKNPFEIQKLRKDEMYEMAMGMVANVNVKNASGYVILPEITVVGTSREGTKVIGRLDILMIDPQGKIHIYDFKTKKVDNMI